MSVMLSARGLQRSFGGVQAVNSLDIEVSEGEVVGLIGPNGAGKTTAFNLMTGELRPDGGSADFLGNDLIGMKPYSIARLGMVRTAQHARIFEKMTVLENMLVGAEDRESASLHRSLMHPLSNRRRDTHLVDEAVNHLDLVGLTPLAQRFAGVLSGGQRKLLEMARVLMLHPKLLMLDEPAAGVNPTLAMQIANTLLELRSRGITMLIIEHNLTFLERVADHVFVMAEGRNLMAGTMDEVRQHEEVLRAYLGA